MPLNSLLNFISIPTRATSAKQFVSCLELARLVHRQETNCFTQSISVSLQNGVKQ